MNVDDISGELVPNVFDEHDRLDWIFLRQEHLSKKYTAIEQENKLRWSTDVPVDLNDRFGQMQLKDFFWRVTEELTEAVQARIDHPDNLTHCIEELADALHFLVEAYILAGTTPKSLVAGEKFSGCKLEFLLHGEFETTLESGAYRVIHALGCASNCLKQRPWKCTHQLVDERSFDAWMRVAIYDLIPIFRTYGLNADQVLSIYWRKSCVNEFRIRSNY